MPKKSESTESYETSLEKLEAIVQKLESGDLSLDDSLKSFEAGMVLVKNCESHLNEAQKRVEILVKSKSGELVAQDFDSEDRE